MRERLTQSHIMLAYPRQKQVPNGQPRDLQVTTDIMYMMTFRIYIMIKFKIYNMIDKIIKEKENKKKKET